MIPAAFDYVRAESVAEAVRLLAEDPDAKLLAGGHSLLPMLKLRLASPSTLIDISGIGELKGIEIADAIRIGALCTHAQIMTSAELSAVLPIFRQTADLIADPMVRNRGTIGGSLANADPAADWPAVVIALNAEIELAGPAGRRRVPAKAFFLGVMTTALAPDEVLVAVRIPRPSPGMRSAYRKIHHPASGYAVVGVAGRAVIGSGRVASATIGVTGAASAPFEANQAATFLADKTVSAETIQQAATLAAEQANYLGDVYASADYRKHLVRTETGRLLTELLL